MAIKNIKVKDSEVRLITQKQADYISLTDIAKYRNPSESAAIISNWLRTRETIDFLGLWEVLSNPSFKSVEFERFKNAAGSNYFVLSPQRWIEATGAIGIISKSGRYGGAFAHSDIAFEFALWVSPEFKLYLIKEAQRLKEEENRRLGWNLRRDIAKLNYRVAPTPSRSGSFPRRSAPARPAPSTLPRPIFECGPLRPNRRPVAGCPSRRQRRHARFGQRHPIGLPGQFEKSERRVHPGRFTPIRAPEAIERCGHPPDDPFDRSPHYEKAGRLNHALSAGFSAKPVRHSGASEPLAAGVGRRSGFHSPGAAGIGGSGRARAWREAGYQGESETTRALLHWWFVTERPGLKYFFAQREAVESVIWLWET
jgi:hypothetical protein